MYLCILYVYFPLQQLREAPVTFLPTYKKADGRPPLDVTDPDWILKEYQLKIKKGVLGQKKVVERPPSVIYSRQVPQSQPLLSSTIIIYPLWWVFGHTTMCTRVCLRLCIQFVFSLLQWCDRVFFWSMPPVSDNLTPRPDSYFAATPKEASKTIHLCLSPHVHVRLWCTQFHHAQCTVYTISWKKHAGLSFLWVFHMRLSLRACMCKMHQHTYIWFFQCNSKHKSIYTYTFVYKYIHLCVFRCVDDKRPLSCGLRIAPLRLILRSSPHFLWRQ